MKAQVKFFQMESVHSNIYWLMTYPMIQSANFIMY